MLLEIQGIINRRRGNEGMNLSPETVRHLRQIAAEGDGDDTKYATAILGAAGDDTADTTG